MKNQISNIALDVAVNPETFADRFLDGLKTTDSFGQIVGSVSDTETVSEFDTVDIKAGQRNTQGDTKGAKGKAKRTFGKSGAVDVKQLLAMPVAFDAEKTVQQFADEIKSASNALVSGQIETLKAFGIIGGNLIKIRKMLVDSSKYADSKNPEKAIDSAFGKALTEAGIGTDYISRPLRADYIFLSGKLTQAKKFIKEMQAQYKADLARVSAKEIKANEVDKIAKSIATKYERVALTPSILVSAMNPKTTESKPAVDTLAKIVANVQNRVEKLDDVSIAQVIEALQKIQDA